MVYDVSARHLTRVVLQFCSVLRAAQGIGFDLPLRIDALEAISGKRLLTAIDAHENLIWAEIEICPRSAPSQGAKLCTYGFLAFILIGTTSSCHCHAVTRGVCSD